MEKPIIWLGLDVHARTIAMARLDGGASTPTTTEIPNDPKVVRRVFGRLTNEGAVHCCYEAGCCGFELQRQLESLGVSCAIVAPSLIPRKPGERIKTDRRDAVKLARLLRAGELTTITIPSIEQEAVRDLVRARDDVRKDRIAARHRLGMFLLVMRNQPTSDRHGWRTSLNLCDKVRCRTRIRAVRPRPAPDGSTVMRPCALARNPRIPE